MSEKMRRARRRAVTTGRGVERLEGRVLLAGQMFAGEGQAVGTNPQAVASGDFDGDGKPDLVVGNAGGATASVLLGNGDGTFAPAAAVTVGSGPLGVAVGDFNRDGKLDFVTANFNANTLTIVPGNGNGTFASATTIATAAGSQPDSLVVGDFNNDAKPDFAVSLFGTSTDAVYLGNGNGTFAAPATVTVRSGPQALAAGDVNGDGKPDLVTPNALNNTITVSLGVGNGTFTAGQTLAVGVNPSNVAIADFTGDNKPDLIVSNPTSNTLSLLLNAGGGTFAATTTIGVAIGPFFVTAADFNGDGLADIACSNSGSDSVIVLLGDGLGAFSPQPRVPAASNTRQLVAVDLNNDGKLDLAAAGFDANAVSVVLGYGNGRFAGVPTLTTRTNPRSVVSADLNGDGVPDLIEAGFDDRFYVSFGNGDGTFTAADNAVASLAAVSPGALAVGDFNADGRPDVVAGGTMTSTNTSSAVVVSLEDGAGRVTGTTTAVLPVGNGVYSLVVGDFNADGRLDVAATVFVSGSVNGALNVLLGDGFGGLAAAPTLTLGDAPQSLITGDFNGDRRTDLALSNYNSKTVQVLLGNGNGTFAAGTPMAFSTFTTSVAAGDFNADGRLDLAVGYANVIAVLPGKGDGTFGPATVVPLLASPIALTVNDFNNDGRLDLAAAYFYTGSAVSIVLGNGNGTFAAPTTRTPIGELPTAIITDDFNGDGVADLATIDPNFQQISVLINQTGFNPYVYVSGSVVNVLGTSGPITVSTAGGTLTVATPAGTKQFKTAAVSNLVLGGPNVTVATDLGPASGNGTLNVTVAPNASVTLPVSQHLASLTVYGTATLAAGGGKLLRVTALTIAAPGRLDLNDNDFVYDYRGTLPQAQSVRGLIGSARAGGAWTGTGLTSTAAKNNPAHTTALGYLEATDYKSIYGPAATFAGETVDPTAVLVRYTLYGDTDLDRGISIADFNRLSTAFGVAAGKTWLNGDFDYDGGVGINDFNLLSANFSKTLIA